jgi:DNA polymerase elongation subunit (family B)
MTDVLLGISPEFLYYKGKQPQPVSELHHPYFLAFSPSSLSTHTARKKLLELWEKNKNDHPKFSKIVSIGDVEQYRSFCDFSKTRDVFKVYTKESYLVPEISDHLFFEYELYTAEHDIPYQQRALVDLAATGKVWLFDTKGEKVRLKVLIYDIETTQFEEGRSDIPVDIIGQASFEVCIESEKNLEKEEFRFDIRDCPSHWKDVDVVQYLSRNTDEEITNLGKFCKTAMDSDIISGHNIVGFDNVHVQGRINWLLKNKQEQLSDEEKKLFQRFVTQYTREDKSFHFGIMGQEVVQMYPGSFDTYLAARKFYPWFDDFRLKALAPFLNVMIQDRVYLTPSQIRLDDRTMKYNKQDVQEQIGLTLHFIQQALPLSFTTCMPFDTVLSSGAVNMWDHMALIRGAAHKKIMPPICRVKTVSQIIANDYGGNLKKEDIVKKAKARREQLSKDFVRVLKYGEEMPDWVQYPYVIYKEYTGEEDDEELVNYHMPGGMTIKPDKEAFSHFIPWYYVVVADVGAMYPTILKAMNIGGDTVRLAKKNETADAWVWLKKLPDAFFKNTDVNWREITKQDSYADKGYMIGIRIDIKPGVVNLSMTGIMSVIGKLKKELKTAQAKAHKSDVDRLKMMYQSMKGARNAGSVDFAQRIMLQNPQGNLLNVPIGEFVNDSFKKYGSRIETFNGTEFEIADMRENWMAVSVNRDGRTELKQVKQAIRHRWKKKLVKITTKSGYTVVTPNHSIFTLKNNKLVELSAKAITHDSLIVHAEKIPQIEKPHTINLIHEITAPGFYAFIEKKHLSSFKDYIETLCSLNEKTNGSTPYLKIQLDRLRKVTIPSFIYPFITVGTNGRKSSRIPAVFPFDEALAELLGYYISEGHISVRMRNKNPFYYLTISCSSKIMHKRIQKIIKDIFKVDVYTLNRMKDAKVIVSTVHAKVLAHLFEDILKCGRNSRSKQVPSIILSSSKSVKKAFFQAYMAGDGNYKQDQPSSVPLGRFTTNSRWLNEDLITLQKQFGAKTNTHFRKERELYNTRMIYYFKGKKESFGDCYAIPPKTIEYIDPTNDYVYDISVEENENFLDANGGILLHNTHGILAAPTVTGRQFNLWGAAAITTKGQMILADTLDYLKKQSIRVVYGDTDGIYLGCARSAQTVPELSKALHASLGSDKNGWITSPETALAAIKQCNTKWQEELKYPDFELEAEQHDAMIFVKHKNYLIFDTKNGKIELTTKGNNFKGSDKANIARLVLEEIMIAVLKDVPSWDNEEDARNAVKNSIRNRTTEIVSKLDLSKVDLNDLTLVQSVQPEKRYKLNQDGSSSTFGKRAEALEKLLNQRIRSRVKMKFVITKKPLPGIAKPSKSGVKPIDYMYPLELLKDRNEIDLDWYKKMIENYIQGAFGLSDLAATEQTGLDAWM